jgi:hypothetical protein
MTPTHGYMFQKKLFFINTTLMKVNFAKCDCAVIDHPLSVMLCKICRYNLSQ